MKAAPGKRCAREPRALTDNGGPPMKSSPAPTPRVDPGKALVGPSECRPHLIDIGVAGVASVCTKNDRNVKAVPRHLPAPLAYASRRRMISGLR